ncbi:hypothetical protein MKZ24_07615 [Paenibacillus sp. FSL R7-0297]|uniref:alginate O-acetyltransferase AlgX-related protein n=1 Tax=Paenibacillus sp. FSL R7-0297 TaxID=2921680 RepID=UPI0030F5840E
MKASKFFNITIAVIFVAAIAVPLIAVNKTSGKISVAENRALAGYPDFKTAAGTLNTHFIKDFENWFSDNMGLRDKLVMTNTKLQYNIFGKLTRSDTIMGNDNWLYLMTPEMLKAYQNLDVPSDNKFQDELARFSKLNNYFKNINIPMVTMVNPDKETVYPEFMPKSILKANPNSRTDLLVSYLSKNGSMDIFSTKDSLLKAKDDAVLYSQNYDLSHWNNYGAFVAYQELMKKMKTYLPDIQMLNLEDFNISPYDRFSGLYGVLPFVETDYNFTLKTPYASVMDRSLLDKLNISNSHLAFRYINEKNENLPKLLIMGDSYIYLFMLPNIAESFSEVTFLHWSNMGQVKDFVNLFNPDLFLLEFMEPAIGQFMDSITYDEKYFNELDLSALPKVTNERNGLVWLDYIGNDLVQDQNNITLHASKGDSTSLVGWALDPRANSVAGSVYVKLGDHYYPGIYGLPRTSVAEVYGKDEYTNSGFVCNIPTSELLKYGEFSLIVVSKDKEYQYTPIEYEVSSN